ncbi:winged helix-turn-helix domain-containing protein [Nitrososphaera sp.]|uniref:winged helix-turn-helix domain-containing protein n=1 Tax=Nitrososphaera sp. TaxID=1971748 RepID=UPI00307F7535
MAAHSSSGDRQFSKERNGEAKREFFEIIAALLLACRDGAANKNQIMQRANMSHAMLMFFLELALETQMIEETEEKKRFIITEKGRLYLQGYRRLAEAIGITSSNSGLVKE